jgi:hypothetical protein
MSWYKVVLSHDDIGAAKHARLQDVFSASFLAMGAPKGAALLADKDSTKAHTYYFSPVGAEMCMGLVRSYAGAICPAPTRSSVVVLVAHASLDGVPLADEH